MAGCNRKQVISRLQRLGLSPLARRAGRNCGMCKHDEVRVDHDKDGNWNGFSLISSYFSMLSCLAFIGFRPLVYSGCVNQRKGEVAAVILACVWHQARIVHESFSKLIRIQDRLWIDLQMVDKRASECKVCMDFINSSKVGASRIVFLKFEK